MKQACIGLVLVLGLAACKQAQPPAPEAAAPAVAPGQAAPVAQDFPVVLQASGNEPFWGVRVEGGSLTYTTPETMDAPRRFDGAREVKDGVLTVKGGQGDTAFSLTITPGECSDGMSDLSHPYSSEFVLGKETFKGCARDPAVPVEAP